MAPKRSEHIRIGAALAQGFSREYTAEGHMPQHAQASALCPIRLSAVLRISP